jgi:hypothetical protein
MEPADGLHTYGPGFGGRPLAVGGANQSSVFGNPATALSDFSSGWGSGWAGAVMNQPS